MDRRLFLQTSGLALGGFAAMGAASFRSAAPVPERLGIQLWMVRDLLPNDFVGVLEWLHWLGYRELEFKGYHDRDPAVVRAVLDDIGLTATSVHADLVPMREGLDKIMDDANAVGAEYVVLAWYEPEQRPTTLDGWRRLAEEVNGFGERAEAAGLQFAYHNHAFEFVTVDDRPAYDVLLDGLDPDLVTMQIDHYWIVKAGYDPVDYLARHPGRFPLWHLKDARGADQEIAPLGQGTIDFARIFEYAETAGLQHAFVDAEDTPDTLETARLSIEHLKQMRGS